MANPLGNLLDMLRLGDDDWEDEEYFDPEDEEYIDPEEEARLLSREKKRQEKANRKAGRASAAYEPEDAGYDEPEEVPAASRRTSVRTSSNKVVPIHRTSQGMEVCICKPKNFNEAKDACEMLLQGRAVVVNLEGIDIMEAQRIMDFIYGCIYAISGKMHQISRYIFIFSPENVDISGDYLELSSGDDFGVPTLNREF